MHELFGSVALLVVVPADDREWHWTAISSEQIAAAASPDRRTTDLVGNFDDLPRLIEQLSEPMGAIELGK